MSSVTVADQVDVSIADAGDPITVIADFEVEVIQVPEQGPPGIGDTGQPGKDGNTILYGATDPITVQGNDGDFYINTGTHFIFGPKYQYWPAGTSLIGPQGPQGYSVLYGAGPPTAAIGIDNDFYIDTTAHFIYGPKAAGAWPAGTSLIGPQGPQGVRGSKFYTGAGAPGTIAGAVNGDSYLNTTNGDVYTMAGGVWGAPVGNIRGPQGVPGPSGPLPEAPTDGALYGRQSAAWVPAAPVDALAYNGLQINGAFDINQFATGVGAIGPSLAYRTDQWMWAAQNAAGKSFTGGPQTVVSSFGQLGASSPKAFTNLSVINCLTAGAAVAAGDYVMLCQLIEGWRIKRLGWGVVGGAFGSLSPITIGFWVAADRAGTMCVVVHNHNNTRAYVAEVAIPAGTPMQFRTVTIPGDVAGTWNDGSVTGMVVGFSFCCGTTYQTPANVWGSANYWGTPNSTNFFQAAGDRVWLTGVTVMPDAQGPNAAQSTLAVLRHIQDEMALCQRYMLKVMNAVFFAYGHLRTGGTASYNSMPLAVPMRIGNPSVGFPGDTKAWSGDASSAFSSFGLSQADTGNCSISIGVINTSIGVSGAVCALYSPTQPFALDARMT